jgi:hypothetical protein
MQTLGELLILSLAGVVCLYNRHVAHPCGVGPYWLVTRSHGGAVGGCADRHVAFQAQQQQQQCDHQSKSPGVSYRTAISQRAALLSSF